MHLYKKERKKENIREVLEGTEWILNKELVEGKMIVIGYVNAQLGNESSDEVVSKWKVLWRNESGDTSLDICDQKILFFPKHLYPDFIESQYHCMFRTNCIYHASPSIALSPICCVTSCLSPTVCLSYTLSCRVVTALVEHHHGAAGVLDVPGPAAGHHQEAHQWVARVFPPWEFWRWWEQPHVLLLLRE